MLAIHTRTTVTLDGGGAFTETFGELQQIDEALVVMDGPNVNDRVFEVIRTIATNVVTVTVMKMQVSAVNTWGIAITADVNLKTFTIVVDGI